MSSLVGKNGPQVTNPFGPLTVENGWYPLHSSKTDIKLACAFLGLFCGITACIIPDAVRATRIWKRPFFTTFKVLVWTQITSSIAFQGIVFAYLMGSIAPTFGLFLAIVVFWCLNSSVVMQVQVNRVSILVTNERYKFLYKWILAAILFSVDVLVCCTWLPVRLQVKSQAGLANALLPIDIMVMLILGIADLSANVWFVKTIRSRLSALGLTKYDALVRYNIATLTVSLLLDGVVIGMMWYPNGFLYMSLFPIIYQVKLNIELGLSDLIVKVASEKTVHRVKNTSRFDTEDHLADQITVAVEEKTTSHQEAPLDVQPTFGQLIKRPEWASKIKKHDHTSKEMLDEEKGVKGYEMQAVPIHFEEDSPKEKTSRSGSAYSLE